MVHYTLRFFTVAKPIIINQQRTGTAMIFWNMPRYGSPMPRTKNRNHTMLMINVP